MRAEQALSIEQVREAAPAVFQTAPHRRTSERYTPISTMKVLEPMLKEGFTIHRAQQKNVRHVSNEPYARHLICLRPPGDHKPTVGGVVPEVVIVNGHDGYTSYHVYLGMYRFVCANGMMLGTQFEHYSIEHRGDIVGMVHDATRKIWEKVPDMYEWIRRAEATNMPIKKQNEFAERAMEIRHGDKRPYDPKELLSTRRKEDEGMTLWPVYNRVQENLLKGGIEGRSANNRRVVSRPIARVTRDVEYNRKLWDLAAEYARAA